MNNILMSETLTTINLFLSNICTDSVGFGHKYKLIIINRTTWRLIKLFLINVTDGLKSDRYYSKMAKTP